MILEEMYNGRFYPCETVVADSPEYKRALKACSDLMETLSERLSEANPKVWCPNFGVRFSAGEGFCFAKAGKTVNAGYFTAEYFNEPLYKFVSHIL